MYLRPVHTELAIPTLRAFIKANPLGILTTAISSPSHPLLQSSHIPFLLDIADDAPDSDLGVLRGHLARANPQAKAMSEQAKESPTAQLAADVLVLFNGPHHYTTPKYYVETKPANGKVVPTWNYVAVQAYGTATVYYDTDPESESARYLAKQIHDLSVHAEKDVMGYDKAWTPDDAPAGFIATMTKGIIGVEIKVTSLAGKWKMSQERPLGDRDGVISGFGALGTELGDEMAMLVKQRAEKHDWEEAEKKKEKTSNGVS